MEITILNIKGDSIMKKQYINKNKNATIKQDYENSSIPIDERMAIAESLIGSIPCTSTLEEALEDRAKNQ